MPTPGAPLRVGPGSALVALVALAAVVTAGCEPSRTAEDGGTLPDVPTIEGGTIRPDSDVADGGATDASDGGGLACSGTCDPRRTVGCGSTTTCSLGTGVPSCTTLPGTIGLGESCESTEACGHGLGCFRDPESGRGVCRRVCCPRSDGECGPGERCGGTGELVGGEHTDWGECTAVRSCDVLGTDACGSREGCYIVDASGTTECLFAGSAEAGAACDLATDCAPGLFCGGLVDRTCLRICSLGAARACPDGKRCIAQSYSPAGSGICAPDMVAP